MDGAEALEQARALLEKHGIVNRFMATDVAVAIIEAYGAGHKRGLNEMYDLADKRLAALAGVGRASA